MAKYPLDQLKEELKLTGEIYPILRNAIVEMYIQPGSILSIKDICDEFKIGRSPVRDALIRLEEQGLVELIAQRGTMISNVDLEKVKQEHFVRVAIEEKVTELFMALHTPSDLQKMNSNLMAQEALITNNTIDVRKLIRLDNEFHKHIYKVAQQEFSLKVVENASGNYQRVRLLIVEYLGNAHQIVKEHGAILAAFQARDYKTMNVLFDKHLGRLERQAQQLQKSAPHLFKGKNDNKTNVWHTDYLATLK